jgi:hypothetical protein
VLPFSILKGHRDTEGVPEPDGLLWFGALWKSASEGAPCAARPAAAASAKTTARQLPPERRRCDVCAMTENCLWQADQARRLSLPISESRCMVSSALILRAFRPRTTAWRVFRTISKRLRVVVRCHIVVTAA